MRNLFTTLISLFGGLALSSNALFSGMYHDPRPAPAPNPKPTPTPQPPPTLVPRKPRGAPPKPQPTANPQPRPTPVGKERK